MIEINNLTSITVKEKHLKDIASSVLKEENKKKFGLSIALVGRAEIKKLNKQYLNKDNPTDVLAFPQTSSFPEINVAQKIQSLGEIIICPKEVEVNAKNFNSTPNKELRRVLIHGILHLLGYSHEKSKAKAKVMRKKEEYYLTKYLP